MTPTVVAFILSNIASYAARHFDLVSKVFARFGLKNPIHEPAPTAQPAATETTSDFLHTLVHDAVSAAFQGIRADLQKMLAAGVLPPSVLEGLKAELKAAALAAVAAAIADVKK